MNQHLVSQPAIFLLLLVKVKFQLSPSPITRIAHILASSSVIQVLSFSVEGNY